MKKSDVVENWLKVNVELKNSLEDLKSLDEERKKIKKLFENNTPINDKIFQQMNASIKSYKALLSKIKELKNQAILLKSQIDI